MSHATINIAANEMLCNGHQMHIACVGSFEGRNPAARDLAHQILQLPPQGLSFDAVGQEQGFAPGIAAAVANLENSRAR